MASVNPLSREVVFKIVYYGPGLGGKTTTLEHLHATARPEHRGKLVSLATPVDRTLYFDFLPIRIPTVRGMSVRLQLFTVPGQVYFNATRKLVLTGADGVVFVSDSQPARADANLESLENLRENLADQGRDVASLPLVFQHNKRDLPGVASLQELDGMLNPFGAPSIATSARTGEGVYDALEAITARVLHAFEGRIPEGGSVPIDAHFEPVEGGLAQALRAIAPAAPTSAPVTTFTATPIPAWGTIPPNATLDASPHSLPQPAAESTRDQPAPAAAGLSFAELWPEHERDAARAVEAALAARRYRDAVELCEALVARVLASAAGVLGSSEAPREAALVPILLGLDGRRYLGFRALVREARAGQAIGAHAGLSAYAFAIEARLARAAIG